MEQAISFFTSYLIELTNDFTDPDNKMWIGWLFTYFIIAFALYYFTVKNKSTVNFWSYFVPKSIYISKSVRNDIVVVLLAQLILAALAFFSITAIIRGSYSLGFTLFSESIKLPKESIFAFKNISGMDVLFSFVVIILWDLGQFINHYVMHKIPFFWEFHKVHHSATVLTPLTLRRMHPVEMLGIGFWTGLAIGFGVASFSFFGYTPSLVVIGGVPLFRIVFLHFYGAFLHSHLWISFGKLNHIVMSPAMHIIHHSVEERHRDKNLALFFTIWDKLFGTLYIPKEKETFRLGLSDDVNNEFNNHSGWYIIFSPFVTSFQTLWKNPGNTSQILQKQDHTDHTPKNDNNRFAA